MNEQEQQTVSDFDRLRGGLKGLGAWCDPSTIQNVQHMTGWAKTFIVETTRQEDGDYIFVQCADRNGLTRIALPPKVASTIARQRDSLTRRRRSIASKVTAKARMDRGELPGFMKKKT